MVAGSQRGFPFKLKSDTAIESVEHDKPNINKVWKLRRRLLTAIPRRYNISEIAITKRGSWGGTFASVLTLVSSICHMTSCLEHPSPEIEMLAEFSKVTHHIRRRFASAIGGRGIRIIAMEPGSGG